MIRTTAGADAFVGLDLGTSGLKGVALDGHGTVLARSGCGYPTRHPRPGAFEQDPADWCQAAATVTRSLLAALDGRAQIRALGLSAMLPTLVLADARLAPVAPAITWQDARAENHGERLRAAVGGDEVYQVTGQWLDGRYLLPMYLGLLARGIPPRDTHRLLGAKDWLLAWLTGVAAADPSTAAGVGGYRLTDGGWYQPLLDATADLARHPLPALPQVVPADTAFALRDRPARALGLAPGLPVCVGAADSVLGALGLGATAIGDVAYVAGTSTVILGVAAQWRPDPQHRYLGTPLAGGAGVGMEMDLLATGSALRWLTRLLNLADEAELLRLAGAVALGDAPAFLPYLAPGEQGALWDPRLRGTIAGLSLHDGPGQLARGLLTGLVLESRRCLATLAEAGLPGPLLVAGGSGGDPGFRADLADACGRAVGAPEDDATDYSAAGAARLAAAAVGQAIDAPPQAGRQHLPRAERAAVWARLAQRHDQVRTALRDTQTIKEAP